VRVAGSKQAVSFKFLNLPPFATNFHPQRTSTFSPMSSSSDSSRKRARHDPFSNSHEEEEEGTNGHQIDPQQTNRPPPPQAQYHPSQQHQQPPPDEGPLLPSFFGIEPYDDFTRRVGDWIWSMSKGRDNVEVSRRASFPFFAFSRRNQSRHRRRRMWICAYETGAVTSDGRREE